MGFKMYVLHSFIRTKEAIYIRDFIPCGKIKDVCIGIFVLLFCVVVVVFIYRCKYIQTKPLNGVLNKGCMIKLDLHVHYKFFTACICFKCQYLCFFVHM